MISTHIGFFKYVRLPFGINSAPAIFRNFMDRVLDGIEKTTCYLDDIIITGSDINEHISNLKKVLYRLKKYNITTRRDKCTFFS